MADIVAGGGGIALLPGLTVPHRILARGYRLGGDMQSGYSATVPYLVRWADHFAFVDQLFGASTAVTAGGAITYTAPHRLPYTNAPLYARTFEVEPYGIDGTPDPEPGENLGLAPDEPFWKYAKVTVQYRTPDAPPPGQGALQQLDPGNPITVCRQSVRQTGKMETLKAGHYVYEDDGKKVPGDYAVPTCESMLELDFPEIPYLPWQLIRPYIGKVNSVAMLGCDPGELLLEGMSTRTEFTTQGWASMLNLSLAACPPGQTWNHLPKPNGIPALVRRAGSSARIYAAANFLEIFDALDRS